jgi:hypothetical protein
MLKTAGSEKESEAGRGAHLGAYLRVGKTVLALCGALASYAGAADDSTMSFFITGSGMGQGGNLGGLSGADAYCQKLADSVGAGNKVWHAYLSAQAQGGAAAVNARDRIGTGPWYNANKVKIASNLTELHDTANVATITAATALTHRGATIPPSPNKHDMMTGSRFDGMAPVGPADSTCANWTSSAAGTNGVPARTIVGHSNRQGIAGNMIANSWNQAHVTPGCSQANVESGGGSGFFYCFAVNNATNMKDRTPASGGASSDFVPYYLSAGRNGVRNEEVVYRFTLDRDSKVEIRALDTRGRERAVLLRGMRGAGPHEVRWNGTDASGDALPAGLYRLVFRRDGEIQAR